MKPGKRLPESKVLLLKEWYLAGIPPSIIAEILDCSTNCVRSWRIKLGLPTQKNSKAPKIRRYALERAIWEENEPITVIAKRYGIKYPTMSSIIHRLGILTKFERGKNLRPGIWSQVSPSGCLRCKTRIRRHNGRGLCTTCYDIVTREGRLHRYPSQQEMAAQYET